MKSKKILSYGEFKKDGKSLQKAEKIHIHESMLESLQDFDLDDLDDFERFTYDDVIRRNPKMSKEEALQLLINNVEGDFSQLSDGLAKIAKEQEGETSESETHKHFSELADLTGKETFTKDDVKRIVDSLEKNPSQYKYMHLQEEILGIKID